jgi:hypothetical protein
LNLINDFSVKKKSSRLNKKLTIYWIKIGGLSASPDRLAHVDHITISFVLPFLSLSLSLHILLFSLSLSLSEDDTELRRRR